MSNAKTAGTLLADEWLHVDLIDFKFVVSSHEDLKEVIMFVQHYGIPHYKVWLMPECTTSMKHYNRWQDVFKWSVENGFNASPRLHVMAFDSKRGI
jgi:7-carboxy-7-deazaguanine synthase